MDRTVNHSASQGLSISRAVVAIVLLLGVIQIGWVVQLLVSSWDSYQRALQMEQVNEISRLLLTASDRLRRESILSRQWLSQSQAPSSAARMQLQQLRQDGDRWMQQAYRVAMPPGLDGPPDFYATIRSQLAILGGLRREIDARLGQAAGSPQDETLGYAIELSGQRVQSAIGEALARTARELSQSGNVEISRMTTIRQDGWEVARVLRRAAMALAVRAALNHTLSEFEEDDLQPRLALGVMQVQKLRADAAAVPDPALERSVRLYSAQML